MVCHTEELHVGLHLLERGLNRGFAIGSQPFHGYRFEGERYDCGDKLGYLEAIVATALARDDLGEDFRALLDRYRR